MQLSEKESFVRICKTCNTPFEGKRCKPCRVKYQANYHKSNAETILPRKVKWRADNPVACCIHAHNYRARKSSAIGVLSENLFDKLFVLQRGRCACCKTSLPENKPHMDHINPLVAGGDNTDINIQLLCASCNLQKSAKHPVTFMQERGFLL